MNDSGSNKRPPSERDWQVRIMIILRIFGGPADGALALKSTIANCYYRDVRCRRRNHWGVQAKCRLAYAAKQSSSRKVKKKQSFLCSFRMLFFSVCLSFARSCSVSFSLMFALFHRRFDEYSNVSAILSRDSWYRRKPVHRWIDHFFFISSSDGTRLMAISPARASHLSWIARAARQRAATLLSISRGLDTKRMWSNSSIGKQISEANKCDSTVDDRRVHQI